MAIELYRRLFESYSLVEQNQQALRAMKTEILPALEDALQLLKKSFEDGRYGFQDIVMAQQALLEAKQFQIESAKQVLLHQALIESLTGISLSKQVVGEEL